jgi:hypothetical protein
MLDPLPFALILQQHLAALQEDPLSYLRESVLVPLVKDKCATILIDNALSLDVSALTQSPCFSLLVSKVLGLGIVAGGAIVKLPQVKSLIFLSISLSCFILTCTHIVK